MWLVFYVPSPLIKRQGGVMAIVTVIVLRETYHPVLLNRRLEKLRHETGNQNLRLESEMSLSKHKALSHALGLPLKLLLFSPVVLLTCFGVAVVTGMLYLLISSLATEFQIQYGLSIGSSGLAYLGLNIGLILSLVVFAAISDRAYKKIAKSGEVKPEIRLVPVVFAAPLCCGGLLMYGCAVDQHVHWMVAIVGTTIFGFGWMLFQMPVIEASSKSRNLLTSQVTTYLIDVFKLQAASAIGANAFLRSLLGGLLPLCAGKLYENLGFGW
jgi:hypothetical protein